MVERVAPLCGSARTAHHNFVFLEGVKAALTADEIWRSGKDEKPTVGLRAVARVYAGWGFSQPFYRDELWRQLGFASLEEFLVGFWEGFWLKRDPANLLAMLSTWQGADISANPIFNGDFKAAMKAITCPAIIMPAEIDLYFPKEDSADEVALMSNAVLDVIPGHWGHFAGGGLNPVDTKYIDDALKRLLAQ